MAESEKWSAADDAYLKGAMATLKHDVDELPLPDPRFVRARGAARRRRTMVTWSAAGAAAAIAVAAVGFSALGGRDRAADLDPARTSTSTTSPSPTRTSTSLDIPSLLPLATEWEQSLDMPAGSVTVTPVTKGGGVECGDALGTPQRQESAIQDNSPVSGAATYWLAPGGVAAAVASLEQGVAECQAGPGFTVAKDQASTQSLFSYSTKDAGSGWFVVVPGSRGVALLQVIDPAFNTPQFTAAQAGALATIAKARLDRYETAASAPATTGPGATGPAGPKAIDEQMTVTGVAPLISSKLFVGASQWASPGLTNGQESYAGTGEPEGGLGGVVQCETDDYLSAIAGRYGMVRVRSGSGDANYIGVQRVRLFEDVEADSLAKTDVTRTKTMLEKGCSFPNGTVKATAGPSDGTYRLDTVFDDGSPTFSQWVGVTTQKTPGAVSTIVITKVPDADQAFAELDRLMALARQK